MSPAIKPYLAEGHVIIERVSPEIDGGRFRAKAVVGDRVEVSADIFRDGPGLIGAVLRTRGPDDRRWAESPMRFVENDRFAGSFRPSAVGIYRYTIEAWPDRFGSWRRDMIKRVEAEQEVDLELEEGALLLEEHLTAVPAKGRRLLQKTIDAIRGGARGATGPSDPRAVAALSEDVAELMAARQIRTGATAYKPMLELRVDRERARFGAWYELFPRSTGAPGKHGTFATAAEHLDVVADMGFDVVYLPPIHPIGRTARKGRNNSLEAGPSDVGSPWAIGNEHGGHTDVHPELGTIDDFDRFVRRAESLGIEVALDFAIQCSPDHPWVAAHPEWFHHRPDGSIKYAENPPKKYQDIYPINFDTEDREGLWRELKSVLDHWIGHGVKIFRVDNPHTKSFRFWEWAIESVQQEHPEVIFLAEAFTRPKVMRYLAKLGFTQSYTYFTWRNAKWDLTEYLTELTRTEMADYFRPNFFANTPDILHEYLQQGGPPAFKIRLILASMLSPTYGLYSGYELFENVPVRPGSEEYLNSEKYELRPRDLTPPGTLVPYIRKVNDIRNKHAALSRATNLDFHEADKDAVIAFSRAGEGSETILVVVNLNPFHWEEATLSLDLGALGLDEGARFRVHDLVSGATYDWHGAHAYVRLDPFVEPAHVFRVEG